MFKTLDTDREKRSLINLQKLHNKPDQREAMVDPDRSISLDIPFEKKINNQAILRKYNAYKRPVDSENVTGLQIVAIKGITSIKPTHFYQ